MNKQDRAVLREYEEALEIHAVEFARAVYAANPDLQEYMLEINKRKGMFV